MTTHQTAGPASPEALAKSPLRNRIRVKLDSAQDEVWSLLGNLNRFPEYSAGLSRVDTVFDRGGAPSEYVCHFKPMEEGGEEVIHREVFVWYEDGRGWASIAEEPNAFGLTKSLTLVTLDSSSGTIVTWDQYYDAEDLEFTKTVVFDDALGDIASSLIDRFGGRFVERYVQP